MRAMTRGSRPSRAAITCAWMAVRGSATTSFFMGRPANGMRNIPHPECTRPPTGSRASAAWPGPSARDLEVAQGGERAVVAAVHDAPPAARAGGGVVIRPVVDEHRGGRLEGKAPLGLGIDAGVRLHDTRKV